MNHLHGVKEKTSTLTLMAVLGFSILMPLSVQANHNGDDWSPLGPQADKILVKIYPWSGTNVSSQPYWADLQAGNMDVAEQPLPPELLGKICVPREPEPEPKFLCEKYNELGMLGIDFNNNKRITWFGTIPGTDEQAVLEIKRAIAHLIDKDEYISNVFAGEGQRLDGPLPAYQELWGPPLDPIHAGAPDIKEVRTNLPTGNVVVEILGLDQTLKLGADVFLFQTSDTGDSLANYGGLIPDGGQGMILTSKQSTGFQTFFDTRDGRVTFTGAPVHRRYAVYAVNHADSTAGWGQFFLGDQGVTVTVRTDYDEQLGRGWYNRLSYPSIGFEEYCEARDHLTRISGGLFLDDNNDCRIDLNSPILTNPDFQPLKFKIVNDPTWREMGRRLAERVGTLFFPRDNVVEYLPFVPGFLAAEIVFSGDPIDDWHLYTMSWGGGPLSTPGRDIDYIDDLYHQEFGFGPCGTVPDTISTTNYGSFCSGLFSAAARAVKQTYSSTAARLASFFHQHMLGSIPVVAPSGWKPHNDAWTSVVNQVGMGINNYHTLNNMHPREPACQPRLLFLDSNQNGCWDFGEQVIIRYGLTSTTESFNPLWAFRYWDFLIIGMIYDTLQNMNPYSLQEDYASMASSWTNFVNPTATQLGYSPHPGTQLTQRWFVKSHLGWHDGTPVTGRDIAFSMLAYKETESPRYGPIVKPINYVRLVSDVPSQIVMDVGMDLAAPQFQAGHIAGILPILPCSLYSTGLDSDGPDPDDLPDVYTLSDCRGITTGVSYVAVEGGIISGVDRRPGFEPTLVADADGDGMAESDCYDAGTQRTGHKGSGPFVLQCTSGGDSDPGDWGAIVLRKFTTSKSQFAKSREYWASPHNYLQWRWADFNNNGVVDTGDKARTTTNPPVGCRNKPVPTDQAQWDVNPADGVPDDVCVQFDFNRNGISSDISDRARMALEGGKRWTDPCVWPWPAGLTCPGHPPPSNPPYRRVNYPWVSWVWYLGHQCNGPDRTKGTVDDDKNACWFTKFASRPP